VLKVFLVYLLIEFVASTLFYDYNFLEYFFRLKGLWASFLVFPFMLLIKRGGFMYLVKLVFPVAIVANILYILSALTGVAFMPGIGIEKQFLPGGLEVFRVWGGTFYGDFLFLGFVFEWVTKKFRLWQLFPFILFVLPQILAFGRGAWLYYAFTVLFMFMWNFLRKKEFKVAFRQLIIYSMVGIATVYSFMWFVPKADYLTEAIFSRVSEGEQDVKFQEGTFGTRLESSDRLVQLWLNSNILFGIGMHPLWVIKPVTEEENLYSWGFADVTWAGVLAAYGIIGFVTALYFQVYFLYLTFIVIKRSKTLDVYVFLALTLFTRLFFDTVLNYASGFLSITILGFWTMVFQLAGTIYKYEHINE